MAIKKTSGSTTTTPAKTAGAAPSGFLAKYPWRKWAPVAAVGVVLIIGIAWAMRSSKPARVSGFTRSALRLLNQKAVQDELQITQDQLFGITHLEAEEKRAMEGPEDMPRQEREKKMIAQGKITEAELKNLLDEGQMKRLKQIYWQRSAGRLGDDPEMNHALGITRAQIRQFNTIQDQFGRKFFELRSIDDEKARQKKSDEIRKEMDEEMHKVLTAKQQELWEEMRGEPFKGEERAKDKDKGKEKNANKKGNRGQGKNRGNAPKA
jgi:hypothetical protein